jgi:hypothetical protein
VGDGGGRPDGGGSADGGLGDGSGVPDAGGVESPYIDPTCVDGLYAEALPTPAASIADLVATYRASTARSFVLDALERRYPIGAEIVDRAPTSFIDCVSAFLSGATGTADSVIRRLSVVVHECGHILDIELSSFGSNTYVLGGALELSCDEGDTTTRGGRTFARSLLVGDDFGSMRPPCGGGVGIGCDGYADVYLAGDGSEQGFNMLMEEAVQYVNSLATGLAFHEEVSAGGGSVSERDGIATLLWWIGRYLHLARTEHAAVYAFLSADPCWRELILTVWGRAWLYLEATEELSTLGIDDEAILRLVTHPAIVDEIERIRTAHGC